MTQPLPPAPDLILAEQVNSLYRFAPTAIIVSFLAATLVWVSLCIRSGVASSVTVWYLVIAAVTGAHFVLVRAYSRSAPTANNIDVWQRRCLIAAFVAGSAWGLGGTLLFARQPAEGQVLLTFAMSGVAAGAIAGLAHLRWAPLAFLIPLFVPFALSVYFHGGLENTAIGTGALLFTAGLAWVAHNIHNSLERALALGFENVALHGSIDLSMTVLETANQELKREMEERRRAETGLREKKRELRTLFKSSPLAIIQTDLNFLIVDWNPAAERLFGYPAEEAIGADVMELVIPHYLREEACGFMRTVIEDKQALTGVIKSLTRDERNILCEWHHTLLTDDYGNPAGLAAIIQDITERSQIEHMKSELIATLNHELRTPLTALRGALAMLGGIEGDQIGASAKNLIRIASSNNDRLIALMDSIMDVARLDSGGMVYHMQPIKLAALLEQTIERAQDAASTRDVSITLSVPEQDCIVRADHELLLKATLHLLSNAIKYSPWGGQVQVTLTRHDGMARCSITDQGEGIPEEFRPRIFERFARAGASEGRHEDGSGLGLYITRHIVNTCGGRLSFDSTPGAGSTFHMDIPLLQPGHAT